MIDARIVAISASPSPTSKTALFVDHVLAQLGPRGQQARHIRVRDIDPRALLAATSATRRCARPPRSSSRPTP